MITTTAARAGSGISSRRRRCEVVSTADGIRSSQNGSAEKRPLVEIRDLRKYFPITQGMIFQRHSGDVKAVDGVSLTIRRGETLGLAGESGCGKPMPGRTILQLERPTGGGG